MASERGGGELMRRNRNQWPEPTKARKREAASSKGLPPSGAAKKPVSDFTTGALKVLGAESSAISAESHGDVDFLLWCARQFGSISRRSLAAHKTLYLEGDAAEYVHVVTLGCLKRYKSMFDGRRQITAFAFAGDVLSFVAINGRQTATAETVVPTEIYSIRWSNLERFCGAMPRYHRRLLSVVSREVAIAQDLLLLGRKTAVERVATFLSSVLKRVPSPRAGEVFVELPMPQDDIADYLGLRHETVSRAFSVLRKFNVIEYRGERALVVRDYDRLVKLASAEEIVGRCLGFHDGVH